MFSKALRCLSLVGYASVLIGIFVVVAYLSFNTFVRHGEMTVPDVRGLDLGDAEALVAQEGMTLRWREGRDRFDPDVPAGAVLQQSPRAGSLIKKGTVVDVTRSLGRQLVQVPDLSGETLQTAQMKLQAAGLELGRLERVYSDRTEQERVVRQSPSAGERVDHLATVDLFLCLDSAEDSFVMPDLVYHRYARARRFFERLGFRVGSVKYEPYEGIDPGVVLRQFPLAGHRLARGDVISLVVASALEAPSG